ncbi:MAG TPA: S8 family serine peptidase [Xanthomonadaceae bacterium]|nr:S8 family serine peptidase [Xanthomonadaceae bacterium]
MKQHTLVGALALALGISAFGSALADGPDADRVWIKFNPGGKAQVERALGAAGARIHYTFDDLSAFAATVPAQALQGLRNNPNVALIEADAPRYPMGQITPYGIPMVQAPDAVAVGADGSGIKVCVIDSGIKQDHEDFAGISMTGYASSGQTWFDDTCGHGSHVAGTVAAADNTVGVIGVSPGKVSLHIVKVFDGATCGWSYSSDLVDAANRCANSGARIISMSLGGSFASNSEANAFANLHANGILSIAAAGNGGNNRKSYPASYDAVMSVAAVDSTETRASFSQYNDQVEISAPGVGVLSTVPFRDAAVTVGLASFIVSAMEGSPQTQTSGALADGGRCASAGSWGGKVVLCERGDISFADKVLNVQNGGGVAAIVYNNVSGGFSGTLGGTSTSIPSVSMSQEDGKQLVVGSLGVSAAVSTVAESDVSGYAYYDGTSMATPHVSGVAALVWSADPLATNDAVRDALNLTAKDLGAAGRDNEYGYGLVQALAAVNHITGGGGGDPDPNNPPTASFTSSCTDLSCNFDGTGSSDSDGSITGYSWSFGDSTGGSGSTVSHTYGAGGTYTVTLTVTDDDGATHSTSQNVTVSDGSGGGGGIQLSGSAYKIKGRVSVDLTWSGAGSTSVDVFRNGSKVATTANDGAHTDSTGFKGSGSIDYRLCEAGTSTCSATITVIY